MVAIAVSALEQPAVFVTDALYSTNRRLNVETAAGAHRAAAHVDTGFLAGGHIGPYPVAGLETVDCLAPHQVAPRKALSGQPGALVAAAARGLDGQGRSVPADQLRHLAHVGRIQRMRLGYVQPAAVILRAAARADFDRQAGRPEALV